MKDVGFEWSYQRGAKPRPTTPELRLADLDRDGLEKEIIYGCLMINDLIADGRDARLGERDLQRLGGGLRAGRPIPNRVFPLAIIPNNDPEAAAAEVRRCAKLGLRAATSPSSA